MFKHFIICTLLKTNLKKNKNFRRKNLYICVFNVCITKKNG